MNYAFATNSYFLFPISLQPDGVDSCDTSTFDYLILQNTYV